MATALLLVPLKKKKIHHRTADDHRKCIILLLRRTSCVAIASNAEYIAAELSIILLVCFRGTT
jgi:superfamily II DNA/RNA helicase